MNQNYCYTKPEHFEIDTHPTYINYIIKSYLNASRKYLIQTSRSYFHQLDDALHLIYNKNTIYKTTDHEFTSSTDLIIFSSICPVNRT